MSTQQNDDESTLGKPKRVVGRPWTREEARAAALAREARKRAAREAAKGYQAPPEPSDAQSASTEPTQGVENDVQQDLDAWVPPKGAPGPQAPPDGDEPQEQAREQARQEQARQARARAAERLAKRQAMRAAIILEDRRLLGDLMDPWQAEDFARLDDPGTRHAYLERPRGHSKTGDIASEALIELLDADLPNRKLYCFAADEDQARLVYDDVVGKLLRGQFIQADRGPLEPGKVRVLKNEIHSYTGSVLKVMAADVASSWGLRPDWVACDEVVEWRYETLWQALWTATGKRPRARVLVISTAGFDQSHFAFKIRQDAQQEADWYFSSRSQCASWIAPSWLEQQRRTLPTHVFRRLHMNEWVDNVGAFLTAEEIDAIFTGEIPPAGGRHAIGLDVGLTKDRTVMADVRLAPDNRTLVVDGLATWQGRKGEKVDLAEVEAAAYDASVQRRAPVWFDPFQAVQLGQNLKKRGRHVEEYTVTSESRRKLFALLLSAIRDRRLKCAPHPELRKELLGLEVKETLTGYRVDHKVGRYDDHVFAVALGVAGALKRQSSGHVPATSITITTADRARAYYAGHSQRTNIDGRGTSYLGDGKFMSRSGEVWKDPRGL